MPDEPKPADAAPSPRDDSATNVAIRPRVAKKLKALCAMTGKKPKDIVNAILSEALDARLRAAVEALTAPGDEAPGL